MIQTTDKQSELFDLVDQHDQVIGQATRGECHQNPKLRHRAAVVFLLNQKGQIFLQHRSLSKDLYPGYWVFSASGHVDAGSNYLDTVDRETQEELGVIVPKDQFVQIGTVSYQTQREAELVTVYKANFEGDFNFNTDEVAGGQWYFLSDILKKYQQGDIKVTPCLAKALEDKTILAKLQELLILVDEHDQELGQIEKYAAHQGVGQHHRAFTAIIVNDHQQILLTKRSEFKPLWPQYWDMSFSSHPWFGEDITKACQRRVKQELGITIANFTPLLTYNYQKQWTKALAENEHNYLMIAKYSGAIVPDKNELSNYQWLSWDQLLQFSQKHQDIAFWAELAIQKLQANPTLLETLLTI
ncbi:isopentenyl-diphosphate Delta-isomerase [Candidatus Beckwithbacteria bacterium]|nr:isopentenyl-diphosphate Delta-isomerase [Candidatus Beckwithbacteria bacterium]